MACGMFCGVQKIQCLESSMADGSHDGEAAKEELAKLLHERNSLPHNLGPSPLPLGRGGDDVSLVGFGVGACISV